MTKEQQIIAALEEALKLYADPVYWQLAPGFDDEGKPCVMPNAWFLDKGSRAKEALDRVAEIRGA